MFLIENNTLIAMAALIGMVYIRAYKTFFMHSSAEAKIILLINIKMSTIVGILTFISRVNYRLRWSKPEIMRSLNFMRSLVEHEKCFITSGPGMRSGRN